MPLFREPLFCVACRHHVSLHKKWSKNGALQERCDFDRGYYWSISLGRLVKGPCRCKGYVPPKIDKTQLRCLVCKKQVLRHHVVNEFGMRRCEYCGTLFGQDIQHPDLQEELRK